MENKDQVIRELQEKILLLESKVDYLQWNLLDAKTPYEVSLNSEAIDCLDAEKAGRWYLGHGFGFISRKLY